MKSFFLYAFYTTLGAILGPVLIAAFLSIMQDPDDPFASPGEASRLVDAYRERLPNRVLFHSVVAPENGKECDYDSDVIFPDVMKQMDVSASQHKFTYYSGYHVLDQWRNRSHDEEWIGAIVGAINQDMSNFEITFLRRCIEATVFSPICMSRVSAFGGKVPRFDHQRSPDPFSGFGVEDQIVCTYVDGVAGQRGLPLAKSRRH
jgi:hypothetical protein